MIYAERLTWGRGYHVHVQALSAPLTGDLAARTAQIKFTQALHELDSALTFGESGAENTSARLDTLMSDILHDLDGAGERLARRDDVKEIAYESEIGECCENSAKFGPG